LGEGQREKEKEKAKEKEKEKEKAKAKAAERCHLTAECKRAVGIGGQAARFAPVAQKLPGLEAGQAAAPP